MPYNSEESIKPLNLNLFLVTNNTTSEKQVVNNKGELQFRITNPAYQQIFSYQDGVSRIRLTDQTFYFIDTLGNEIVKPHDFDGFISNFSEGLAMVAQNQRYGFMDKTGKIVIPLQYESVFPFPECNQCYFYKGKARVLKNNHWISIDKNGKCIEDCR